MSATGSLPASQALPLISQYESNNQNVLNTQGSTASGYYQIINGTWAQFAPQSGVDIGKYPTAMSAPPDVQAQVATTIYNQQGFTPWSSNTKLLAAVNAQGGNTSSTLTPTTATITGSPTGTASGGGSGSSGWFSPIWNYISRGVLLLVGFGLVFIALAALLWSSKATAIPRAIVGGGNAGSGQRAAKSSIPVIPE